MRHRCINLISIVFVAFFLTGCARGGSRGGYSRTEPIMGTFLQIKVNSPQYSRIELNDIVDEVVAIARGIERKVNIFDSSSEINKLNVRKKLQVSPELFSLIKESIKMSRITDGMFDITVAPILKKDGFYGGMPEEISSKIPDSFGGVGWKNIVLNPVSNTVSLSNGAWIDLSGIAKGYIVDRMADVLRGKGIDEFLINAGGDIYCSIKSDGGYWKIGVRDPGEEDIAVVVQIEDYAIATSGDYENVIIEKNTGEALSHIINPQTKEAGKEAFFSVTVISPKCGNADALATAMMVMGKDKAISLADSIEGVDIIVVEYVRGEREITFSKDAAKYVAGRE